MSTAPWRHFYPGSVDPSLTPEHASMIHAWDATLARVGPEAPCVYYFDRTITMGQVDQAAWALARGLASRGLRPGDRLAIYMQNDPHWLIGALAAWRAGAIVAAVNPMWRAKELTHLLTDSGARYVLCLDSLLPVVQAVAHNTDVQVVVAANPLDYAPGPMASAVVPDGPAALVEIDGVDVVRWADCLSQDTSIALSPPPADGSGVAMLTYTSGTTGRAKGAMNLHRNLAHSTEVYASWFAIGRDDVVLGVAPLFHITGSVAGMCLTIATGAPLVLLHRFDADVTLRAIDLHRATFTVAASTALIALITAPALADADVSSLTKIASGGAPVSPALVERIRSRTGWHVTGVYGMTETSSPTHLAPPDHAAPVDEERQALSVGVPVPGLEFRLVDVESGDDVPAGSEGEIVVRGPMVVPGYWDAPEESAHAIRDGWLHTGDVGIATHDGWLFVVDRIKDLINAGGYKVWPREVEDALALHPEVREVAVVGVPDEYRGETVKAFVSLNPGASVTGPDIIEFARERMAAYKRPTLVEVLPDIPKNASGKILRRKLR